MKMKKLIIVIFCIMLAVVNRTASAQDYHDGTELKEFIKIAESYRIRPFLTFSVDYGLSDSAYWPAYRERLTGQYKISNGRYWSLIDSTEIVQGGIYNLAIYHDLKMIVVSNPAPIENYTIQVPILDSMFEQSFVDSMHTNEINDSTRQLCIIFKPESPYKLYEIFYDPNTYLIREIKVHQNNLDEEGVGYSILRILFFDVSETIISDDVFNSAKYISRSGGAIIPTSMYSEYEIVINGDF